METQLTASSRGMEWSLKNDGSWQIFGGVSKSQYLKLESSNLELIKNKAGLAISYFGAKLLSLNDCYKTTTKQRIVKSSSTLQSHRL